MKKYEKEVVFKRVLQLQQRAAQSTAHSSREQQSSSLERKEERGKRKDEVEGRCKRVQGLHFTSISCLMSDMTQEYS